MLKKASCHKRKDKYINKKWKGEREGHRITT